MGTSRTGVAVLVVALLAGGAASCGKRDDVGAPAVGRNDYRKILPALCQALSFADAGKTKQANAAYYDNAHFGLHGLAADVAAKDSVLGGRLFRQHAKVEGDLSSFAPALSVDLHALIDVTATGLVRLGVPAKDCLGAPVTSKTASRS